MDPNLIYAKTTAGEEAILQRTRVIQRNVRMVLILVDGQSTVADLSLKTGNQQLTENALLDLEKGGFIELKAEQDSLWQESRRVALEIRNAAIEKAIPFTPSGIRGENQGLKESGAEENLSKLSPASHEVPISMHSVFNTPVLDNFPVSQFSIPPTQLGAIDKELPEAGSREKRSKASRKAAKRERSPYRPSFLRRMKSLMARVEHEHELEEENVKIKPVRRGARSSIGWPAMVFFVLLGILALGYLAIVFFPYEILLPDAEAAFSRSMGRPVKIGAIRAEVYPVPGLLLKRVQVEADKEEIRIEEILLKPELDSFFASRKVFSKAVLIGMKLPAESIAGLAGVVSSLSDPASRVGVRHIGFEKSEVSFGGLGFRGLEGEVRPPASGALPSLSMSFPDRSLTILAQPVIQGLEVTLDAFNWRASQGSPFVFDSASLKGKLENGAFAIGKLELRIFDGLIQGTAVMRADAGPAIAGEILFERVNASRFGEALGIGKRITGEAAGKIRFSAMSEEWESIFSAMTADGEFSIRRGSIVGIDLAEAVRRVSGGPVQGGLTAFEDLTGRMKLSPERYQFSGLVMNSGRMRSVGHVDINKGLKLNGRMELQLQGTANQARVPVAIDGTLNSPTVQVGG